MKSGPLCALLWRILTWCSRKHVISPTHSRQLNVIADKLSSLSQTGENRQKGPSSYPPVITVQEKLLATEPYDLTHLFILSKTRAD